MKTYKRRKSKNQYGGKLTAIQVKTLKSLQKHLRANTNDSGVDEGLLNKILDLPSGGHYDSGDFQVNKLFTKWKEIQERLGQKPK